MTGSTKDRKEHFMRTTDDPMEWAEAVVLVPDERADREGLPCLYCSASTFVLGERVREHAHDECKRRADEYALRSDAYM